MCKSNKLYLDCSSGISGDMFTGALLDVGADESYLKSELKKLNLDGYRVDISKVFKSGIKACDFNVILDHENHDHDMDYLHGNISDHGKNHTMHTHDKHNAHAHHEHRSFSDIKELINNSKLSDLVKQITLKIFGILADAEAKAHDTEPDKVHFHEVGAVDSIVDIVSAAVCIENLNIKEVYITNISEGSGTIRCQHGIIPVPVPAVCNIVSDYGLKLNMTEVKGELVTPTGAAIAAAIKTNDSLPANLIIEKAGYGAGKRSYENASGLLRAMLIKTDDDNRYEKDIIYKLESNIDDCTGEILGYVMERILNAGARDVNYTPVYMKKNRPAYQINILCDAEKISEIEDILFTETTTIGVRKQIVERTILKRKIISVDTLYGPVKAKVCFINDKTKIYPEYESAATVARTNNISLFQVYEEVKKSFTR